MTTLEAYQDIIKSCFTLQSNLNDTFYWGTADMGEVAADDIPKIIHIYQQCGSETLVAYEAIVRGHDPDASMIAMWKDKGTEFYRAKALLQPLADSGKIMFERWYGLQEKEIERSLFNGQEIIWKGAKAILPDGTESEEGGSISDRRNQLVRKFNAKHDVPIQQCEFPDGDANKPCRRCHLLGKWATGGRTGVDLDCMWPSVQVPLSLEDDSTPPVKPEVVMIKEGYSDRGTSWSEEFTEIKTAIRKWWN